MDTRDVDLADLAKLLEPRLANRLRELVAADGGTVAAIALKERARQAEDLVDELRLHLAARERDLDEALVALQSLNTRADEIDGRLDEALGIEAAR